VVVDDTVKDTIKVNCSEDGFLYTAKEVVEGITIKQEDKDDVTTDSGVDSDEQFDLDVEGEEDIESDFDNIINGDTVSKDENI